MTNVIIPNTKKVNRKIMKISRLGLHDILLELRQLMYQEYIAETYMNVELFIAKWGKLCTVTLI